MSILILFSIFLCQNLVSAKKTYGHVDAPAPDSFSNAVHFPWHETNTEPVSFNIEIPNKDTYIKVQCRVPENEYAKAAIFSKRGAILDSVILDIADNPCDEAKLKNYFLPRLEDEKILITYLWSSKNPKCITRTYEFETSAFMAMVYKKSSPREECPENIKQYIQSSSGQPVGGVVEIGPLVKTAAMDFNANVAERGESSILRFPGKDLLDKTFTLVCRTDKLEPNPSDSSKASGTITTGILFHDDVLPTVIDKFKMTSCDISYINVNRQIYNGLNNYKVVLKDKDGVCYERSYQQFGTTPTFYYIQSTLLRERLIRVPCPRKFVGDIGLNAWRPWYKILFKFLFAQPEAFEKKIDLTAELKRTV